MKIRYAFILLTAIFLPTAASAEFVSGTLTEVDTANQMVTIRRSDTGESVPIHVKDRNSIANLQSGSRLDVDAKREVPGGWETERVDSPESGGTAIVHPSYTSGT